MQSNTIKIIVLVIVIAIGAGIITYSMSTKNADIDTTTNTPVVTSVYTDGTYSATGNYVSPGGQEAVQVKVTLANNIITDVSFQGDSVSPISQKFQKVFSENYKPFVIGKNITEVKLSKVSGSSLTPKGFNDAIAKIRLEARS
jgi:uncharacterized protein with FMN-binding domain